jgi:hypothetical protein
MVTGKREIEYMQSITRHYRSLRDLENEIEQIKLKQQKMQMFVKQLEQSILQLSVDKSEASATNTIDVVVI